MPPLAWNPGLRAFGLLHIRPLQSTSAADFSAPLLVTHLRQVGSGRRPERRGLSGLGLILVVLGLVVLAVNFAKLPPILYALWPLILIAVGLFGLVRRPGWVRELDLWAGPQVSRFFIRPQRVFSLVLILVGLLALPFTLHVLDGRLIGPGLLIVLGILLLYRRSR